MKRKKLQKKQKVIKSKSLFDHLNQITKKGDLGYWNELSDEDKKTFQPYMVNRFLSMNPEWVEFVDDLQRLTVGLLSKRDVFRLYNEFIPKSGVFLKYVKSSETRRVPDDLAPILMTHFEVSESQAKEYFFMLLRNDEGKQEILELLYTYGVQMDVQKKIKKELGF